MARTNRPGTGTLMALALGAGLAWLGIVRAAEPAWSTVAPMGQPRAVMTATPLLDGRVLVTGGIDAAAIAALNTAEIFDPASNEWSTAGALSQARYYHVAAALEDGRVLVIGGFDTEAVQVQRDAELYDPAANSWTLTGPTTGPRFFATSQLLPDGRVLVAGGYDNVEFNSVESAGRRPRMPTGTRLPTPGAKATRFLP